MNNLNHQTPCLHRPYWFTRLAAVSLLLLLGAAGWSSTFYVAPNGSDRGSGSLKAPFASITGASSHTKPGDTVIVKKGVYRGDVTLAQGGSEKAGNVVFRSEYPYEAVIVGTGYSAVNVRASYITISGFDIRAKDGHGVDAESVSHIVVSGNRIHDCGGSGVGFQKTDYALIEDNVCFNNAFTNGYQCSGISIYQAQPISDSLPGFHNIIRRNICFNNMEKFPGDHTDGNGIIIDDFHNGQSGGSGQVYPYQTLVENNLCYGNGGRGIHVYVSDHVTVRNNTCYGNNRDNQNSGTWRGDLSNQQGNDNLWVNNIAWADPKVNRNNTAILCGATDNYDDSETQFLSNLTFSGMLNDPSVDLGGTTHVAIDLQNNRLLGVSPGFVRPGLSDPDFRLGPKSIAIRHGLVKSGCYASDDILKRPRYPSVGIDLGCYAR